MAKLFVLLTAAALIGGYYMIQSNDEAMAKCQAKGFSYDTCFHSLNR